MNMFALALCLAAAGGGQSPTNTAVRFEAMAPRDAVAGQPIQLFVGIRNMGREPLAFVGEPGLDQWIKGTSYEVESTGDQSRGSAGGTSSGASHALMPGQSWCPSGDDLLLLPRGSGVFRMHKVTLDPSVVGTVILELQIRVLKATPSLACGPAEFLEGKARTRFVVRSAPAKR